jgi:hypothetical protein
MIFTLCSPLHKLNVTKVLKETIPSQFLSSHYPTLIRDKLRIVSIKEESNCTRKAKLEHGQI